MPSRLSNHPDTLFVVCPECDEVVKTGFVSHGGSTRVGGAAAHCSNGHDFGYTTTDMFYVTGEHLPPSGEDPRALDPADDPIWLPTDDDTIDTIVDGENLTLMKEMIYKLKAQRDKARRELSEATVKAAAVAAVTRYGGALERLARE